MTEPESQIRRLCSFAGVTFEPAMVNDVRVVGSSYRARHFSDSVLISVPWTDGKRIYLRT